MFVMIHIQLEKNIWPTFDEYREILNPQNSLAFGGKFDKDSFA